MHIGVVPSRPVGGPRTWVIFPGRERSPAREIAKLGYLVRAVFANLAVE